MMSTKCEAPLVTIAIPTFNRGSTYLPRALAAALAQTYANLDILVADNASTDGTPEFVRSIADPRIRYHRHRENMGSARNINHCIAESLGEYTLLLNDDDVIDADLVAACMSALPPGARPGLLRTGTRIIDDAGATIRSHPNDVAGLDFTEFVIAWTQGKTTPFLCSTLFLTDALRRVGMHSRHSMWDDVITELKVAALHGRLDIVSVHASYCEHGGELTHAAATRAWCEDSAELIDVACALAPQDRDRLRSHLVPFLANLNYRRAAEMNASIPGRLRGGWIVFKATGVAPPFPYWAKHVVADRPWYRMLVRGKRLGRKLLWGGRSSGGNAGASSEVRTGEPRPADSVATGSRVAGARQNTPDPDDTGRA